jgi:hypothetical protein
MKFHLLEKTQMVESMMLERHVGDDQCAGDNADDHMSDVDPNATLVQIALGTKILNVYMYLFWSRGRDAGPGRASKPTITPEFLRVLCWPQRQAKHFWINLWWKCFNCNTFVFACHMD